MAKSDWHRSDIFFPYLFTCERKFFEQPESTCLRSLYQFQSEYYLDDSIAFHRLNVDSDRTGT